MAESDPLKKLRLAAVLGWYALSKNPLPKSTRLSVYWSSIGT